MNVAEASQPGPIVITGANGFIGRALVAALSASRDPFIAVSRSLPAGRGASFVHVADYRETPCPPGAALVHLAEEANIASANARGHAHVDEVRGVTEQLSRKGFRRIVYASSGQIYRAGKDAGPYIAGKRAAEEIVLTADGVVVRLGNVYGTGMSDQTLLADIMRQIPGTGPLRLRNAAPRRDFIWVEDAAQGFVAVAKGNASGIFDLGSGASHSAGEVARLALDAAGEHGRPIAAAVSGAADEDVVNLDIAPMRAEFGWEPRMDLRHGLGRLIRATA